MLRYSVIHNFVLCTTKCWSTGEWVNVLWYIVKQQKINNRGNYPPNSTDEFQNHHEVLGGKKVKDKSLHTLWVPFNEKPERWNCQTGSRSVVASGYRRELQSTKWHDGCPLTGWQKRCWILIVLEIYTTAHNWQNWRWRRIL